MDSKYTEIMIIRHGRTAWNEEGRVQGQCSVGLDAKGWHEAEAIGRYLAIGRRCSAIYSSDLPRSMETAIKISAALALPINADPKLREISAGNWEGKKFESVSSKDRAELAADPYDYRFPGGETWKEVQIRTLNAFTEIASLHMGERVVIVTHGGPIRTALATWGHGDIESLPVPNGSITQIHWHEKACQPIIVSIAMIPSSSLSLHESSMYRVADGAES